MSDRLCQRVPEVNPSLVQSTRSGIPGKTVSALSRFLGHREWRMHLRVGVWGNWVKDQTGVPIGIITKDFPRFVVGREFQSTCLPLRSPSLRPGSRLPKQAVRSAPISGGEGVRYTARIFTVLLASVTWMTVASKWVSPRTGTVWWTIPRRTRMAVPPPAVSLPVRWQT
jgi:hypothetical protein